MEKNPQRARSNNSSLILRGKTDFKTFKNLIQKTKEFGEPGFLYVVDEKQLLNPCFSVDTKILTEYGWRTFGEMLSETNVNIHQDNRVIGNETNGVESWDVDITKPSNTQINEATNIRKTASNQDIYELSLTCGRQVKATSNHHFATKRGMVELKDLKNEDDILIPVPDAFIPTKNDDYWIGYLLGMVYGDGTYTGGAAYIDIWTNDQDNFILNLIENKVHYFIDKYKTKLIYNTNVNDKPTFSKDESFKVGNVTKYRLSSVLLKQIFCINGIDSKNDGFWLHQKSKDFKSGFLSAMFYCDGHFEYSTIKQTPSIRLTSINYELLKNLQLVIQELGALSNIKLLKKEGIALLPDGNRDYKEYKTKTSYRLIIGGKLNCINARKFITLAEKDIDKFDIALKNSKKDYKTKYFSKVKEIKYIGKEDVYCLSENNRRTLIAEGMSARRCFEISFIPVTQDGRCGFQMCNLTSINGAKIDSLDKFKKATEAAALIGTLQATYTEFEYFGKTSEELTRDESLLGVSITGMMDNPDVLLDPINQKICANIAVATNEIWSKVLNINPAARVTCIKPEGTSSIILGAASGIHPHHSKKYFRRIQINKEDNVYQHFKKFNPHACEESKWSANKTDDVITFPIEIPDNAIVKSELGAIKHLEIIKSTQKNWVNEGTTKHNNKPLKHSVSCTVIVKDGEWDEVTEYLYNNQEFFTAVSLLPERGDKIYKQAPMESAITEDDEKKWNQLATNWLSVDYSKLEESDDSTNHAAEAACAGGQCELNKL